MQLTVSIAQHMREPVSHLARMAGFLRHSMVVDFGDEKCSPPLKRKYSVFGGWSISEDCQDTCRGSGVFQHYAGDVEETRVELEWFEESNGSVGVPKFPIRQQVAIRRPKGIPTREWFKEACFDVALSYSGAEDQILSRFLIESTSAPHCLTVTAGPDPCNLSVALSLIESDGVLPGGIFLSSYRKGRIRNWGPDAPLLNWRNLTGGSGYFADLWGVPLTSIDRMYRDHVLITASPVSMGVVKVSPEVFVKVKSVEDESILMEVSGELGCICGVVHSKINVCS